MDRVMNAPGDEDVRRQVRGDVHDLCRQFPLYDFVVA